MNIAILNKLLEVSPKYYALDLTWQVPPTDMLRPSDKVLLLGLKKQYGPEQNLIICSPQSNLVENRW